MSLFTRRCRVDVSTSDSEINSVASSGDRSPDEVVEEFARMALAGHYYGSPKTYETNEMLRGHGLVRRPRASEAAPSFASSASASPSMVGPSPPLSAGRQLLPTTPAWSPRLSSTSPRVAPQLRAQSAQRAALRGDRSAYNQSDVEAGKAADVSRALERMYRRLAREYAAEIKKEDDAADAAEVEGDGGDTKPKPKKKRRQPDELARARLLSKSKVQELRQAVPYHKVKEREEEERKRPKRVRVPQKAIVLGRRLHLEAQEKRNTVEEMQKELEKQKRVEEDKACTFHPTISRYAERLAAASGSYTFADRLENQALREEELQRLRFEHAVEQEKECTFRPTLSLGTEELLAHQRCRHSFNRRRSSGSSGSRSRSRLGSCRRRRHSSASAPSHEPFEPGERLYRDGAERLLRQQIRLRRAVAHQQHNVIGGQLRLSAEEARDLAHRFESWAASRAQHQAQLREEVDRQARGGSAPTINIDGVKQVAGELALRSARRQLSRSPSVMTASTARPKNSPFTSRDKGGAVHDGNAKVVENSSTHCDHHQHLKVQPASPAPLTRNACLSLSISHTPAANQQNNASDGPVADPVPAVHRLATASSTGSHGRTDSAAQDSDGDTGTSVFDPMMRKEQLRIRLGALFFKYAVAPTSSTVSLAEVERQVCGCYPEDAGVAAALRSSFDEHQRLTKHEFMAALARYIAQNGPQQWCMIPRRHQDVDGIHDAHHPRTLAGQRVGCVGGAGAALSASTGDFMERLNAPTSSTVSSAKEGPPRSPSRSAVSSNAGAASRSATPTDCIKPSTAIAAAAAAAAAAAVSPSVPEEPRPLRTHIYHHSTWLALSNAPPSVEAPTAKTAAAVTEESAPKVHCGSHGEERHGPTSTHTAAKSRARRPASRATSPSNVPAAQLVQGYEVHVQRYRRSAQHTKAGTDAKRPVQDNKDNDDEEECTFQPTLNRRSVALSNLNVERRMLYARELQLRRQQLQVLRASVLKAAGGGGDGGCVVSAAGGTVCDATVGGAAPLQACATRKTGHAKKRDGEEGDRKARLEGGVRTPSKERVSTPMRSPLVRGDGAGGSPCLQGQSPSVDLSSLSSATAQGGATASCRPSAALDEERSRGGAEDAVEKTRAILGLPASASNGATEVPPNVEAASMATSKHDLKTRADDLTHQPSPPPESHFHAMKPSKAILADDDALTPRRAARRQQKQQQQQS